MKRLAILSLLFFALSYQTLALAEDTPPLVKVIATGGTIANTPEGRISGEALVAAIPELVQHARLEVVDLMRVGSSKLGPEHWLELGKTVNQILADEEEVKGVVVTMGSNTMPETAYFLNLVVKSHKPVVLVAAQRTFTTLSSDGPKNFLQAVQVAASDAAVGKGVLAATNDVINGARALRKSISNRMETFNSGDMGYLGYVDDHGVAFYREPLRKHTTESEFDIANVDRLPRVDIFYAYAGAAGDYIEFAVEQAGAEGVVVAGFPTGVPSRTGNPDRPWQDDVIRRLVKAHQLPVVMTNRGWTGRILPNEKRPHYIWGDNLTPQQARILLMLALTKTRDLGEIQRMFQEY